MDRRSFLIASASGIWASTAGTRVDADDGQLARHAPAYSVVPVVGDGNWVWTRPPEGPTGYLEARSFRVKVGIELQGQGPAGNLAATTPIPVPCPEQRIEESQVLTVGCRAAVQEVGEYARQLVLQVAQIVAGQTIRATWQGTVQISKQYHAYKVASFPQRQVVPTKVRHLYLGDSPGIQTRIPEIRSLVTELTDGLDSPWGRAARFAEWVRSNIRPQMGRFTNVQTALTSRRGDCEEMSAIFVALCRAVEIPARLVWVPNHNWAEFYLVDQEDEGHWIPAHTACYRWFGWTGAHELVLQKGDRLRLPQRGGLFRLQDDWMQWSGKRPAVTYQGELEPLPSEPGMDPGPGKRQKQSTGEWQVVGHHPLDRYVRR